MKKILIIFDFDHTLFNTFLLKEKLARMFVREGVGGEDFHLSYQEAKSRGFWRPDHHIASLTESLPHIDGGQLQKQVDLAMLFGSDLLYEDTLPALRRLKSQGHHLA